MNFLRPVRVHRAPGVKTRGLLIGGGRIIRCALGRSGPTVFKREGDGGSPAARPLRPLYGYFRADRVRRPLALLPFSPINADDGWCDAPQDANYNQPVRLPFAASHEKMMRDDRLYDICVVLDWNMAEVGRARHRGSAIFLHLCKPGYPPTEGCIAIEKADMVWLLKRINRNTRFIISP